MERKAIEFMDHYQLHPRWIPGQECLRQLLKEMEQGLAGKGNIPMIPSYLPMDITAQPNVPCCVLDAGGTNLRVAKAVFDEKGQCSFSLLTKNAMPGTQGELSCEDFYSTLAEYVCSTGCVNPIGFCFSYNVMMNRELDGILEAWCKEVRVPDAPGKPVGASLRRAVGEGCETVRVLNDTTAALLGAHCRNPRTSVALILGTGINTCYAEPCRNICKLPEKDLSGSMIISTEIGEFRGIPKNRFEEAAILASDDPALAHAEKQCAGAYLGAVIREAWAEAVRQEIIPQVFAQPVTLPQISDFLAKCSDVLPEHEGAHLIARVMIRRAAKVAAILTAGTILRSCAEGDTCTLVIEGSQYTKLTGFAEAFRKEVNDLLNSYHIQVVIEQWEDSCLTGAALAAFAETL